MNQITCLLDVPLDTAAFLIAHQVSISVEDLNLIVPIEQPA